MNPNYSDIIGLPHHVSGKYPHMSRENRAAQFAPFAALTGYEEAVLEAARLTAQKLEITEERREWLNRCLGIVGQNTALRPEVSVLYYQPDGRKLGGAYLSVTGRVRRIDLTERLIWFEGGNSVPIDEMYSITSPLLAEQPE